MKAIKLLRDALGVLESEYEPSDCHQELIGEIRDFLDNTPCTIHVFTREVVAGDPVWCVTCGKEKLPE